MVLDADILLSFVFDLVSGLVGGDWMPILSVFLISHELVSKEACTNGKDTGSGCTGGIGGLFFGLHALSTLLVELIHVGPALHGLALHLSRLTMVVASGNAMTDDSHVELASVFATGAEEFKETVHLAAWRIEDLVQWDGGETNNGISHLLIVQYLDKKLRFIVITHVEGLVPIGGLARVLLDLSLLECPGVSEIESELAVWIVLSKALNILKLLGRMNNDGKSWLVASESHFEKKKGVLN